MRLQLQMAAQAALLAFAVLPASASTNKSWVSSTGTDSGACLITAPCRTFQYAHDQTTAGGEIDVKDSGSYGQVTITKGISIVSGESVPAVIGVPPGETGITVAAGSQEKVVLQGLFIDGHGAGATGIQFNSGYSLTIEGCHVRNLTGIAIALQPNAATVFHVKDTEVASAGKAGIAVQPAGTALSGDVSHVFAHDSTSGIVASGSVNVSIIDSVMSGNNYGIEAANGANMIVGQSTLSENKTFGIHNISGTVQSYGDNYINANGFAVSNGADVSGNLSGLARR